MKRSNALTAAYWATTLLVSLPMLAVGLAYFAGVPTITATFVHLGYPPYIVFILGTAKILGAIALVQWQFPRLKEWAYAGFTFNLLGAVASHLFAGDPVAAAAPAAAILAVLLVSYRLNQRAPTTLPSQATYTDERAFCSA